MNFVTQAEVISVINHKNNLREYLLKLSRHRKYNPASFVQLTLDIVSASDIWPESRTFSIASYQKGTIRLIIKKVGEYTKRIFNELTLGSTCTIKYPFGELFNKSKLDEKHVFIAGGVGITPFIGLVEYFSYEGSLENVHLFYSVKNEKDLLYFDFLKNSLKGNIHVFVTRESTDKYINRRIEDKDYINIFTNDNEVNYYICGPKEFIESIKIKLKRANKTKIYMDEWE